MRVIPVMLALLLALSPGVAAVQTVAPTAARPADQTASQLVDRNTTVVLGLGTAPDRTAFDSPSASLGSSLAMGRGEFRTQFSANALDQQLQTADAVEKQKQILNRYRSRLENRIISLKAEERQATRAFSNGSMTKSEYLRTLGYIDVEAARLRNLSETMQDRAESVPRFRMETEANTLKGKLVTLEGPVRDRIARRLRGESSPMRVYVETGDTGVVLSTIVNGEYVREIVRTDRRNPGIAGQNSMSEAREAMFDGYPWAYNNSKTLRTDARYGTTNIYKMVFLHSHGRLVVFYDGGTSSVFKEIQQKRLTGNGALPAGPAVSESANNVTLTVNRTYAGGPLRVRLANATGAPLDGEVTVADRSAGRTGEDGVVWTLAPAERFRVSATYEDTTVNVTTTPYNVT